MLLLGILTLICVLSLMSKSISNISFNRIGFIIILFCLILSLNTLNEGLISHSDTGIFNGLWQISLFNKTFYTFIYFISLLVLLFAENKIKYTSLMCASHVQTYDQENNGIDKTSSPLQNGESKNGESKNGTGNEYSLFILLNCLGMISLISSFDLISFFLGI